MISLIIANKYQPINLVRSQVWPPLPFTLHCDKRAVIQGGLPMGKKAGLFIAVLLLSRFAHAEIVDGKVYETDKHQGLECPVGQTLVNGSCAKIVFSKKTVINFTDGAGIDGSIQKPGMDYIVGKPQSGNHHCDLKKLSKQELEKCVAKETKLQIPCPEDTYRIGEKCRDPYLVLKQIQHRKYDAPVTLKYQIPVWDDPNPAISPEAEALSRTLREMFEVTKNCPQDFIDIELLTNLIVQGRAAQLPPIDFSSFLAPLQPSTKNWVDPKLALECGFNSDLKIWFWGSNFYCIDQNTCFSQAYKSFSVNCSKTVRDPNSSVFSQEGYNCDEQASVRDLSVRFESHFIADVLYLPLGNGVVLIHAFAPPGSAVNRAGRENRTIFVGLLFAPGVQKRFEIREITATPDKFRKWDRAFLGDLEKWLSSKSTFEMSDVERARLKKMIVGARKRVDLK